jgi:hypothetical protein
MTSRSTVPALIPLSLLQALRNLDAPLDDGLEELASETVAKRFGLSDTVAAQIERYEEMVEGGDEVPRDEAMGVLRLVGRRSDAQLAFADAGRRAARHAAKAAGRGARTLIRVAPGGMSKRVGFRTASKAASRTIEVELRGAGRAVEARIADSLAVAALPEGEACGYIGSMLAELLRLLAGMEGAMTHDRCRSRGDAVCVWHWADAEGYR